MKIHKQSYCTAERGPKTFWLPTYPHMIGRITKFSISPTWAVGVIEFQRELDFLQLAMGVVWMSHTELENSPTA